jgi:hypothetical protein
MQEVAILGRKQEDQAIDQPEQLAEIVGERQFTAVQLFAHGPVRRETGRWQQMQVLHVEG